jgi:16S rRNA processing protein RimM
MLRWEAMATVGRIARAHGIRGQVIVNPETDFPHERFQPGVELFVNRRGAAEAVRITSVRFQHDRPVLGLEGFDDMTAATALAGAELRVPVERLVPLPEGVFYQHDLVGCVVETATGRRVGVVREVEGAMGGQRLVVDTPAGQVLVPLAVAICTAVDPTARRIVIEPPDGLLDLNVGRRRHPEP